MSPAKNLATDRVGGIETPAKSRTTRDTLYRGRLAIAQDTDGYRFSVDAPLLAHFAAAAGPCTRLCDLGAGSGIVGLSLLAFGFAERLVALEIQPRLLERLADNVRENAIEARTTILAGDLRRVAGLLEEASFDRVVCNPPFSPPGRGYVNLREEIAIARHQIACTIEDVARAARYLLAREGSFALVYPSADLASLFLTLGRAGLTPVRLRFVHPRASDPANRVLLEARVDPAPLVIEPALATHRGRAETRALRDIVEGRWAPPTRPRSRRGRAGASRAR